MLYIAIIIVIFNINGTQGVEGSGTDSSGEEHLRKTALEMHRKRWENIKINLK
jgi:hypothetical protein